MPRSITEVAAHVVAHVVLLTLGVVLTLAGLRTDRSLPLMAGVVLVVLAALGPDSTRLSIKGPGIEVTIKRRRPGVLQHPRNHGTRAVSTPRRRRDIRRRWHPH
jgi:hypothetical protein